MIGWLLVDTQNAYDKVTAPTSLQQTLPGCGAGVRQRSEERLRIKVPDNLHLILPLSQFKYCPKCGSAHFEVHNEKSKQCADCGFVYYFNPSSATVALILNERDELLVCRRAKEPAKGTLDLPGGFIDMTETGEEGVAREVREETGMKVAKAEYLFSLPNIYIYSGFPVHTLDMFFRCTVEDTLHFEAMDDAADLFFLPLKDIRTEEFGLGSIRKGVGIFLEDIRKNKSE